MGSEREIITETVISAWSDEEWTLDEFTALLASIPAAHRETARIKFERGHYDEGDSFKVTYERPETDGEIAERLNRAARYAEDSKRAERQQYERLKRKFEG